mgnify:CR=1 FL=1
MHIPAATLCLVMTALTKERTVFYIDNLKLYPVEKKGA